MGFFGKKVKPKKLEVEGDNSNLNHNPNSNIRKHSSSYLHNRKPLVIIVRVPILGQMLQETWGAQAAKTQKESNDFLHKNLMCISIKLVTIVLGDHGQ